MSKEINNTLIIIFETVGAPEKKLSNTLCIHVNCHLRIKKKKNSISRNGKNLSFRYQI